MNRDSIDQRILRVAQQDGPLVTARRLREVGVSSSAQSRRVASGLLTPVVPHVYAVGPVGPTPPVELLRSAAVRRCTGPAGLGFETAAQRLGIWNRADGHVHVISNRTLSTRWVRGVTWHTSSCLEQASIIDVDGVPTTDAVRTSFDLGRRLRVHQLTYVLCQAHVRHLLDLDELTGMLATHIRAPGVRTVRRAIRLFESGSVGTKNGGEDYLLEGMFGAGLPEPHVNVRGITGIAGIEPDFAWTQHRLVVELDGGGPHSLPQAAEQDRLRDERLKDAGWRVRRFSGLHVFHDRADVLDRIASELRP